jgi:hypothetical protein
MKRNFSYSEMHLWEYDRAAYERQYVLGEDQETTQKMELGTIIHAVIEEPRYPWLKELLEKGYTPRQIAVARKLITKALRKRPVESEVVLTVKTPTGTSLLVKMDGLDRAGRVLTEFKTSDRAKRWTQWAVDTADQLSFYAYAYHLVYHAYLREIMLYFLNTTKGTMETFHTARGPKDLDHIATKIERVCDEIHAAGLWEKRLSRKEREKKNQLSLLGGEVV